jgi:cytidine deaminase
MDRGLSGSDQNASALDRELIERAAAIRPRAHAPYSHFPVGAALRTAGGTVFAGCNGENASYPEGWCAETAALAAMLGGTDGPASRRVEAVAVVAERIEDRLTTPCGGCRQRLAEFGHAGTLIHCTDPSGAAIVTWRLGDLLPTAFALEPAP